MKPPIDLTKCEIRTPTGDALLPLYEMLVEAFPVDRPVFNEMIATGRRFYTWTPYCLYRGDLVVGSVSLVPMRIWLAGQAMEVVGIASVATRSEYRRQGIAGHLLRHALRIVEERRAPAVLFTGLPGIYQRRGFKRIEQTYLAASAGRMEFARRGHDCEILESLDDGHLDRLASVYAGDYPNYDGKVVRDPDYWQLYQMLLNLYPKPKILSCTQRGRLAGYARVEPEDDRLLVSEICGDPRAGNLTEALLSFVAGYARQIRLDLVTLALPRDHYVWQALRRDDAALQAEPPGADRETFMVRPAPQEDLGPLGQLQWSLADKF